MGVRARLGAAALVLLSIVGVRAGAFTTEGPAFQKTVKDKLYTKEQATRGGELYVKFCEKCHTPEKVPEGKKPGPPVSGPKFIDAWVDRPVGELFDTILNTMPSDGSATLTEAQALDAVAHILKLNGFPEGTTPLKNEEASRAAVIVK